MAEQSIIVEHTGRGLEVTFEGRSAILGGTCKLHRDFKTGDPSEGTAKVLRLTEQGTCLVPVTVVADPS